MTRDVNKIKMMVILQKKKKRERERKFYPERFTVITFPLAFQIMTVKQ